ncbi:putative proline-rich transmembrane protein 2 [Scophthalmus maximus]|uniref:Putative proline-rich transmembrane protein 2 n=1 Tax=Scophthalmus maximus TaxID=52904 RepID=A0A2U9AXR3_SCOMX|nr:putative proline-rich transmembrane protein 2 [Scophthalmus maximus]
MVTVSVIVLSLLATEVLSAPVNVREDSMTLFHGEDFHIMLPSLGSEVTFRNRSAPRSPHLVLMRGGAVINNRTKLNRHLSHLIIDAVGEEDEGVYTVKNPKKPEEIRHIMLIVRDCSNEEIIKYGDSYHIKLSGVTPPITLEYRPIAVEANQTSRPALVLLTSTGMSREGYQGRISVNEHHVSLSAVTGADEGSYTVRDAEGVIQRKVCLNVKERQNFVTLPYGKRLKINLILNVSLILLYYTPNYDLKPHLLLDKGEFTSAQEELGLQDRLSLEGSMLFLDEVKGADAGQFKIVDILGFTLSTVYLEVDPYKLESLYVAIIALLGLLVFLLLACLLSCLIKVKKRANRAAALKKIAQSTGKEDEGEAFRQVVKNITKLSEESKHSQADNTEKSQSTEVDIKGLEVSSKEVGIGNLETSDSGVGFNTALPLDTDTDAPDQIPDSEAVSISVATETQPSPPSAAESKPSAPPAMETQPSPVAETKASPTPETKKTPDLSVEAKSDVAKQEVKLSPALGPEPMAGLSPADPKPASSPSPEPKHAAPKAPTPESKSALTPTPEPPKQTTPEPITNGAPEPGLDSKPTPDHTDIIGALGPKAAPPKTPEVERKSGGAVIEDGKDDAVAEDSTTT